MPSTPALTSSITCALLQHAADTQAADTQTQTVLAHTGAYHVVHRSKLCREERVARRATCPPSRSSLL